MGLYNKWQILSEDEHTKYIYDWDDGCWNVIVRRVEKKESPWYTMQYRRSMFTIMIHSKTKSANDIDYWFVTDSLTDRLRYDFKEERFSTDSMMFIHNMKFYNSKHKLYKDQEKMRECYKLFITNTILVWLVIWKNKEIIELLEENIFDYKHLCSRIPYRWNAKIFKELHKLEDEKRECEEELEKIKEEFGLHL